MLTNSTKKPFGAIKIDILKFFICLLKVPHKQTLLYIFMNHVKISLLFAFNIWHIHIEIDKKLKLFKQDLKIDREKQVSS